MNLITNSAVGAAGIRTGVRTGVDSLPSLPCSVTNKEKRDEILLEYCKIIDSQKVTIINNFNTSFEEFLNTTFKEPKADDLSKFINDIIFLQMKKSILDNYYVQNSIVIHMFQDKTIKGLLIKAFNANKNKIFDTFVDELKENVRTSNGGDSKKIGDHGVPGVGGVPPTAITDALTGAATSSLTSAAGLSALSDAVNTAAAGAGESDASKIAEIIKWFPAKEQPIPEEMFYLVKNKIGNHLNNEETQKMIQNNVTTKLQQNITKISDNFMNELPGKLKIRILYALLTSKTDRRIPRKFKGSIDAAKKNGGFNNFESFMNVIIAHFGQESNTKLGGKSQSRKQKKTKKGKSRKNKRTTTNKKTRH